MKRLCLALLTGVLLQGPAWPRMWMERQSHNLSPNGLYDLVVDEDGIRFFKAGRRVWSRPLGSECGAAVSDGGELVVCVRYGSSTLLNSQGEPIAHLDTPMEFELDPPRTCWISHGFHYLELSQGGVFRAEQNHWQKIQNPATIPNEVLRHQQLPVSEQALVSFLGSEDDICEHPPNFRNLSPAQIDRLRQAVQAGQPRAAQILGLARCQQARTDLLKASFAPNSEPSEEAQRAVILLDGLAAPEELVPALNGWTSPYLMRLYEQVPCPEAVPLLLRHLSKPSRESSHGALVAQTRVDLGYNVADWQDWLSNKDKNRLEQFQEPSAPLWKAQQDAPDLRQILLKQPRLIATIDVPQPYGEEFALRGNRLIRRKGFAKPRILEWNLTDGQLCWFSLKLTWQPDAAREKVGRLNQISPFGHFRQAFSPLISIRAVS